MSPSSKMVGVLSLFLLAARALCVCWLANVALQATAKHTRTLFAAPRTGAHTAQRTYNIISAYFSRSSATWRGGTAVEDVWYVCEQAGGVVTTIAFRLRYAFNHALCLAAYSIRLRGAAKNLPQSPSRSSKYLQHFAGMGQKHR